MSTRKVISPKHWRKLVDDQPISGMTIVAYCEKMGINKATFYNWRSRFRNKFVDSKGKLKPVELKTNPFKSIADQIKVEKVLTKSYDNIVEKANLLQEEAEKHEHQNSFPATCFILDGHTFALDDAKVEQIIKIIFPTLSRLNK